MTGKTHLSAGVMIGTAIATISNLPWEGKVITFGVACFGALLLDIDTKHSIISQRNKLLRLLFKIFIGGPHRGITHKFLTVEVLTGIVFLWGARISLKNGICFALAFLLGAISHILLDRTHVKVNSKTDKVCRYVFYVIAFVFLQIYYKEKVVEIIHAIGCYIEKVKSM